MVRGAGMGGRALSRLLVLAGGLAVLWFAGGPAARHWAPNFVAAFHHNGVFGR